MRVDREVVIVGSGFAGSILARMLRSRGKEVLLLERDQHPRFAIGESSTPLAALALERIAREYDLPDLDSLAAYGRWSRNLPGLRRGLKRGFSFYRHHRGELFRNDDRNDSRFLVAASPRDDVADVHWLRADVDEYLAGKAVAEGAELWTHAEAAGSSVERNGIEVDGLRDGRPFRILAQMVVDATGAGSFLSRTVPIASALENLEVDSRIVGGHFAGVRPLFEVAGSRGANFAGAPYPEERAAVHHLLEEGWMYVLPFDHGVVSAGILLDNDHPESGALSDAPADEVFQTILGRYPSLAECFENAELVSPLLHAPRLQRRLATAAGDRWLLLPHAFGFVDPMFSTGIAWSLHGVMRAAELLSGDLPPSRRELERYDAILQVEADQIGGLIAGALHAAHDFRLFCSWSFLYFSMVAWQETRQRLDLAGPAAFLGADQEDRRSLLLEARIRLDEALAKSTEDGRRDFESWIAQQIAPIDLIGLADETRNNLYPVDLEVLVERAHLLGMSREAMRQALPTLLRS